MPVEPQDASTLLAHMREGFIRDGFEHRTLFGAAPPDPKVDFSNPEVLTGRLEVLHELAAAGRARFRNFVGWGLSDGERARLLAATDVDLDAWPHRDRQAKELARVLRCHGDSSTSRHRVALLWACASGSTLVVDCQRMLRDCADPQTAFRLLQALPEQPHPDLVAAALAAV